MSALLEELRTFHKQSRKTDAKIAEECGLSEVHLTAYLTGALELPLPVFEDLAHALGLRIELVPLLPPSAQGQRVHFDRNGKVLVNDEPIHLTPYELKVVHRLAETPGRPVKHGSLLELLGHPANSKTTAVRVLMNKLRRMLPVRIKAAWGRGYTIHDIERYIPAETRGEDPPEATDTAASTAADANGAAQTVTTPIRSATPAAPSTPSPEKAPNGGDSSQVAVESGESPVLVQEVPTIAAPKAQAPVTPIVVPRVVSPAPKPLVPLPDPQPRAVARPDRPSHNRAEELGVIERFLAERGVTKGPEVSEDTPQRKWDQRKRRWVD